MAKTAIITGITGQDGSYLADLLLNKGYRVVGLKRRTSLICTDRVDHLFNNSNFILEYFDLNDVGSMWSLINKYKPDEIYNLAAQSHVRVSFDLSEHTVDGIAMGTWRLLNAAKELVPDYPFDGESRLMPASPYACAKVFAHNLVRNYRMSYGQYACSGILFNHESPRRGETFVTRKITMAAARIKLGLQDKLFLGNLDAKRDWGFAGDYVKLMYMMLQQDSPDDYVIATGETHSVKEFLDAVFDQAGLGSADKYVEIDPRLFRPQEVPYLLGDSTKAREKLGWTPEVTFEGLAKMMFEADLKHFKKEIGE